MIDLHTHSTVSDGSDPPAGVVRLAAAAGCRAVALTDHDRLDGLAEARAEAAHHGVELVPGCELSCAWSPGTLHLLVYFVETGEGPLQEELVRLQVDRHERNLALVRRLRELGVPITAEEVEAEAGNGGVGRPHVAAVLVAKGVTNSIQEAFDGWLGKGAPAYIPKGRLEPSRAIHLARRSGGLPTLAHPLSLGLPPEQLREAVAELADAGLVGLEAYYGRYEPDERAALIAMAEDLGLVATGGSDHHGRYKPGLTVGSGAGDLEVPDSVLEALAARRA
ncbi:MAG TPA: PHP domain-containing protein [Acidimicrobiales bacterium]|nr:PHP domain-containing protein [Acidimicrobiales bacterium]